MPPKLSYAQYFPFQEFNECLTYHPPFTKPIPVHVNTHLILPPVLSQARPKGRVSPVNPCWSTYPSRHSPLRPRRAVTSSNVGASFRTWSRTTRNGRSAGVRRTRNWTRNACAGSRSSPPVHRDLPDVGPRPATRPGRPPAVDAAAPTLGPGLRPWLFRLPACPSWGRPPGRRSPAGPRPAGRWPDFPGGRSASGALDGRWPAGLHRPQGLHQLRATAPLPTAPDIDKSAPTLEMVSSRMSSLFCRLSDWICKCPLVPWKLFEQKKRTYYAHHVTEQ